ncbi:unnamed protein product [Vitrella brassicaformis CCMP3155]|uniref:Protein kinase domain-containing protein n=1 Tax=Vitrella brassicaformis (strain CCMP3155) TaxID=1169540 RepID=A0A0G4EVU6_VITBC|nr:unnamed protein product [Vitrella brassicaformis CCMP3155]|eukprot:CEM02435.1 unnamed protein product [Vitrella brassicaformis CCMP3155]
MAAAAAQAFPLDCDGYEFTNGRFTFDSAQPFAGGGCASLWKVRDNTAADPHVWKGLKVMNKPTYNDLRDPGRNECAFLISLADEADEHPNVVKVFAVRRG